MNRKSLYRMEKPGVLLRRTVSPILFIVITGSDQVNVGTQVSEVLQVQGFNLFLSQSAVLNALLDSPHHSR